MSDRKATLVAVINGFTSDILALAIAAKMNAVFTTGNDRALKIWCSRDSHGYWPSVVQPLPSEGLCLDYHAEMCKLFVGLNNGEVQEYLISEDCNKLTRIRTYSAHTQGVTCVIFSLSCDWLLTCGRDKLFTWHCCETGERVGAYQCNTWCTCMRFDDKSRFAFIGDNAGVITVVKLPGIGTSVQDLEGPTSSSSLASGESQFVVALRGHSGPIKCLEWDTERRLLFSGSFDQSVIVWDIGGQRGSAFELQGHTDKVQALCYSPRSKVLLSAAIDQRVVAWPMDVRRVETPAWQDSNFCQKCNAPFFWNWRASFSSKRVGVRQHHCRKCGKAVCDACSVYRSTMPLLGFENEVRMCVDCFKEIRAEDRVPLCTKLDAKHAVVAMWLDESRSLLATAGNDRVVKLWDAAALLSA